MSERRIESMSERRIESALRAAWPGFGAAGPDHGAQPDLLPGPLPDLLPDLSGPAAVARLLDVAYVLEQSPVGELLLATTERGLVRVAYLGEDCENADAVLAELAARLSPRVLRAPAKLDPVRRELDDFFAGRRIGFDLKLDWRLTDGFTRRVLQATARIPYGSVSSYKLVAAAAGSPRAFRAAGTALGRNPIPIVVPCHRVLHAGGGLGGYAGGLARKQTLLRLEGAR